MAKSIYIDKNGKHLFEVPYSGYPISDGMSLIGTLGANARYGYVDVKGNIIVQPEYETAGSFSEGLAYVAKKIAGSRKYGYIDHSGKLVIDFRFSVATTFHEGLAACRIDGKWGFINKKGKIQIAPKFAFKETPMFSEGLSKYKESERWGFINKSGRFQIKPKYFEANPFSEGMAAVAIKNEGQQQYGTGGSKWGFINKRGKWVIPPKYQYVGYFKEGLAIIWENSTPVSAIDIKGKPVIDFSKFQPMRSDRTSFSEGLVAIKKDDKWGFIDKSGEMVIEPIYERVIPPSFSEGFCNLKHNNKTCFIDRTGKIVLETDAFTASDFSEGIAVLNYL